jgi:putative N6-adenine-specific DNA methylase
MSDKFEIIITTLFGLEDILAEEITRLGVTDYEKINRAVKFKGNIELLYKCNYLCRTAIKVLQPIEYFKVENEAQLYSRIKEINWRNYLTNKDTFAIDGTTSGTVFTHSKYVALKSKDAIADFFREKTGIRPSVDTENPDLRINIHIAENNCTVSLDSTGTPLTKRGYKLSQTLAPLSEVLAAGLILSSGWNKNQDLIDPMCGSGTIAIEAAMIAANIAPGKFRDFAFEKWKNFNGVSFRNIKTQAKENECEPDIKIMAFDRDRDAIRISVENAKRAGVDKFIEFEAVNFFDNNRHFENSLLLTNPPYGERLEEKSEMIDFYKNIGSKLKHYYENCQAWILSGNHEAIKFIGLKPSSKKNLFNGPIDCKFYCYNLYKGSKKAKS